MPSNDKPLWLVSGKREVLLDLTSVTTGAARIGARPVQSASDLIPKEDELSLVWREYPQGFSELPHAIVAHRATLDDLFAWSATYMRGVGPLSSYCRILLTNEAGLLFDNIKGGLPPPVQSAFVGLIIAEVLVLSRYQLRLGDISLAACESTLAYLFTRAIVLRRPSEAFGSLPEKWLQVKTYTHPNALPPAAQGIADTCKLVAELLGGDQMSLTLNDRDFVRGCLRQLISDGQMTPRLVSRFAEWLGAASPLDSAFFRILELPPQERVDLFDKTLPAITNNLRATQTERSFATAMVGSFCKPGSFQQYGLLREHSEKTPESMLWFGLIQGLQRTTDALAIGEGLGRRVLRELLRDEQIAGRPYSDINLFELEILSRGNPFKSVRTAISSQIRVEVQPAIYTVGRWKSSESEQTELAFDSKKDMPAERDPVEELSGVLRYAENLVFEIKRRTREGNRTETKKHRRRS